MSRPWSWSGRRPAHPILSVMESDGELLLRLRSGDERAFVGLVERYHEPMLHLAASFVPSRAVAEEVVQDTWLALLRGLEGFEGRSSLKTWLFRILVNRARTTGTREQRSVPVADPEPAVDPSRFDGSGSWADPPEHWIEVAEGRWRRVSSPSASGPGSMSCPPASAPWCSCATSRGWAAKRSARCSSSARATSGSCCTVAGAGFGSCSRMNSGRCGETSLAPRPRLPAGRRAGDRLPGRHPRPLGQAPLRGAPGRLPALHRVPGADARDHQPHRSAGARGSDPADAGRVRRPIPPVEV